MRFRRFSICCSSSTTRWIRSEQRYVREGFSTEKELAIYDLLGKDKSALTKGLSKNLEQLGVTLIEGHAVCTGLNEVLVTDADGSSQTLQAQRIILAGGSRSAAFPGMAPDHDAVLDSTDMLRIAAVPESLIVVGAGAIGLEMADFFSAMGSKVTVVEAVRHTLPPPKMPTSVRKWPNCWAKTGITCISGISAHFAYHQQWHGRADAGRWP